MPYWVSTKTLTWQKMIGALAVFLWPARFLMRTQMRRLLRWTARAVAFLASEGEGFLTRATMDINGGVFGS